ncbi:hypothetical protein JHK85_021011 [Glycine max]|nr:hypothetical protein JHK85_021011 [Glycine max]
MDKTVSAMLKQMPEKIIEIQSYMRGKRTRSLCTSFTSKHQSLNHFPSGGITQVTRCSIHKSVHRWTCKANYDAQKETNRLEYLIPKKTSLRHRLPMGDQGFIDFVAHLLEVNPKKRPSASEALKHPWLSYPYEPISS